MSEQTSVTILATLVDKISAPLGTISGKLANLQAGIGRIGVALQPLNNQFLQLAAALGAVASVSSSIAAAEGAVRAEQRLYTALRGRTLELERIKATTAEIQKLTEFEGDALNDVAATMISLGIAAEDVPKALKAAVDASAALGMPIQAIVRSIARFDEGEGGRLTKMVPELKKLQEEGRLAAEGFDKLNELFGGAAAKQAETTFGRITQATNAVGDEFERIGAQFAKLKLAALEALQPMVVMVADFIDSNRGKVIIQLLMDMIPALIKIAAVIAGIFAAVQLFNAAMFFAPIITGLAMILEALIGIGVAIVTFLVTPAGLVTAAIAAIVAAVLYLTGAFEKMADVVGELWDDLSEFASGLTEEFKRMFDEVAEGKLTLADFFDYLTTRFKQFLRIFGLMWDIGKASIGGIIDLIKKSFTSVFALLVSMALTSIKSVVDKFLFTIKFIATQMDKVFGSKMADSISLSNSTLDTWVKAAEETLVAEGGALINTPEKVRKEIKKAYSDYASDILNMEFDLQRRLGDSRQKLLKEKEEALQREIDAEKAKNAAILSATAQLQEDLAKIRRGSELMSASPSDIASGIGGTNLEAREALMARGRSGLDDLLQSGGIDSFEYLRQRRALEESAFAADLARTTMLVDQTKAYIAALQESLDINDTSLEGMKKQVDVNGRIQEAMKKLVDFEKQRQTYLTKSVTLSSQMRDVMIQVSKTEIERARRAQDDAAEAQDDLLKSVKLGTTSVDNALAQINAATEALQTNIDATRRKVTALLSIDPDPKTKKALEDLTRELDRMADASRDSQTGGVSALFGQVQSDVSRARAAMDRENADIGRDVAAGRIGSFEAADRREAAEAEFISKASSARDAVKELAEASPELAQDMEDFNTELQTSIDTLNESADQSAAGFFNGVSNGIQKATDDLDTLAEAGSKVGESLVNDLSEGLVDVFIKGEQSFKQFLKTFLAGIAEMIAKALIMAAIKMGLQAVGVPVGGPGMASGGPVIGPDVRADIVPARLMPGEWVIRRDAVDYYGDAFMAQVNARAFPRSANLSGSHAINTSGQFSAGGAASGPVGSERVVGAVVVADNQSMERLLKGGQDAMIRWLRSNAGTVRGIIGG